MYETGLKAGALGQPRGMRWGGRWEGGSGWGTYVPPCTWTPMFKILQARFQQYANRELPDVQAGFRKGRGPENKLPTSAGSLKKQESSRKTAISALLTMPKPLTVWITINCGKFWKRWEYQTTWPASWETPGVGDGQGGLACCDSWGCKESVTTEWPNYDSTIASMRIV